MPLDERKLLKEIRDAGCSVKLTAGGHFLVLDQDGNPIAGYAVKHPGKREVFDHYVVKVRRALIRVMNR